MQPSLSFTRNAILIANLTLLVAFRLNRDDKTNKSHGFLSVFKMWPFRVRVP